MVKSVSITKKRRKLLTIENPAIMEILRKKKGAENQRLVGDLGIFWGLKLGITVDTKMFSEYLHLAYICSCEYRLAESYPIV